MVWKKRIARLFACSGGAAVLTLILISAGVFNRVVLHSVGGYGRNERYVEERFEFGVAFIFFLIAIPATYALWRVAIWTWRVLHAPDEAPDTLSALAPARAARQKAQRVNEEIVRAQERVREEQAELERRETRPEGGDWNSAELQSDPQEAPKLMSSAAQEARPRMAQEVRTTAEVERIKKRNAEFAARRQRIRERLLSQGHKSEEQKEDAQTRARREQLEREIAAYEEHGAGDGTKLAKAVQEVRKQKRDEERLGREPMKSDENKLITVNQVVGFCFILWLAIKVFTSWVCHEAKLETRIALNTETCLAKRMPPEQIAEAQKLARECKPTKARDKWLGQVDEVREWLAKALEIGRKELKLRAQDDEELAPFTVRNESKMNSMETGENRIRIFTS